ncbi:MAG: PD-(D/E)XK motif protein [Bacteroidetes bacterium]|nr:PD-(D/E)XK motif protein [Bacteroidota bacterium]
MNLIELFDSLNIPEEKSVVTFNATPIPEFSSFRIAVNCEGYPVLLIPTDNSIRSLAFKNFKLKYLQLEQSIECKITESGNETTNKFTVITFTSNERGLQEYFLKISETFIKTLNTKANSQQIIDALIRFVEVFRALNELPTKTVQGLWSELFFIYNSKNPEVLLNYWHNLPEEKFDFNFGVEKIEVKSSASMERIHIFASEQLNPLEDQQVLIVSLFVRPSNTGISIENLVDFISNKVKDPDLIQKLNSIVGRTLGSTLEQSIGLKYDLQIAKESCKLYRHQDIKKIEKVDIPDEVHEVKYKSDLTHVSSIDITTLTNKQILFQSI